MNVCDAVWYDMLYDVWHMTYNIIWYYMLWYMIWCHIIWSDMIWYDTVWSMTLDCRLAQAQLWCTTERRSALRLVSLSASRGRSHGSWAPLKLGKLLSHSAVWETTSLHLATTWGQQSASRLGGDLRSLRTPSPPTKSLGFRGFDSSKLLILKGGNHHVRIIL